MPGRLQCGINIECEWGRELADKQCQQTYTQPMWPKTWLRSGPCLEEELTVTECWLSHSITHDHHQTLWFRKGWWNNMQDTLMSPWSTRLWTKWESILWDIQSFWKTVSSRLPYSSPILVWCTAGCYHPETSSTQFCHVGLEALGALHLKLCLWYAINSQKKWIPADQLH